MSLNKEEVFNDGNLSIYKNGNGSSYEIKLHQVDDGGESICNNVSVQSKQILIIDGPDDTIIAKSTFTKLINISII